VSRQTVKLTPGSSGLPYQADMQDNRSKTIKPPAYPFMHPTMSKNTREQNNQTAPHKRRRPAIHPKIPKPSQRPRQFGEPVSTNHTNQTQERNRPEIFQTVTFFATY
jgi:hypothetical protein